jgi:hypothetical protein
LKVNGDIRASYFSLAQQCYIRKTEQDDMILNIPTKQSLIVYEEGGKSLFSINSSNNITTNTDMLQTSNMGINKSPSPDYALVVKGRLNIDSFYDNLSFTNGVSQIGVTPSLDMVIQIPNDRMLSIRYNGGTDIIKVVASNNAVGIMKDPTDGYALDVGGNFRCTGSANSSQLFTTNINANQGTITNLKVNDLLLTNSIKSEKTGSVFAYSLQFNTVFDLATDALVVPPGEPGSETNHINVFDTIAAEGSPYVASYGDVANNQPVSQGLVDRSGVQNLSTRLFQINRPLSEKMNITKFRFVFRLLHFDSINNPIVTPYSNLTFDEIYESYMWVFLVNNGVYDNVPNEFDDKRTLFKIRSYAARGYSTNISPWIYLDPTTPINRNNIRYYGLAIPWGNAVRVGSYSMQFK